MPEGDIPAARTHESIDAVMRLLWPGAMATQALRVAASLGLADLVAAGPKPAPELAAATGSNPMALTRLLRALAALGLFVEDADGRFGQTPMSDTLRRDHPQSLRPWAMVQGAPLFWQPTGALDQAVRTGLPPFDNIYGSPFFDHLAASAEDAALFNASMSSSPVYLAAVVDAVDFSRFSKLVDVGGGHGRLLAAILAANPGLRGVLYDLPAVVAGASALRESAVAARAEIVAGDFFEDVPAGGDAYILKGILHDWDDAAAGRILRNLRAAIAPQGRMFVVDTVLSADNTGGGMMDLLMMVLCTGCERTEEDFRALFRDSGFELDRVIQTERGTILEGHRI